MDEGIINGSTFSTGDSLGLLTATRGNEKGGTGGGMNKSSAQHGAPIRSGSGCSISIICDREARPEQVIGGRKQGGEERARARGKGTKGRGVCMKDTGEMTGWAPM